MRRIIPKVPGNCVAHGFLYAGDPHELGEDMLDVALPNGILLSAGWYPEEDPLGRYRVSVYHGLDEIQDPIFFDDVQDASDVVQTLASRLNGTYFSTPSAGVTTSDQIYC